MILRNHGRCMRRLSRKRSSTIVSTLAKGRAYMCSSTKTPKHRISVSCRILCSWVRDWRATEPSLQASRSQKERQALSCRDNSQIRRRTKALGPAATTISQASSLRRPLPAHTTSQCMTRRAVAPTAWPLGRGRRIRPLNTSLPSTAYSKFTYGWDRTHLSCSPL